MSATLAAIGYGYVLSYSTTLGGTYTAIGAIEDTKLPKTTVDAIEIVRNDSPTLAGEKIPGWIKSGDYEVKITWDKTSYATACGLVGTGTAPVVTYFWKFIRPDGTSTTAFAAFVSEISDEVPLQKEMTYMIKLTVSGMQTFTHS